MYVVPAQDGVRRTTIGRLSGLRDVVRRRYSEWAKRRHELATARALYLLTDIELRDMGLSRGEIPTVISGTYHRE